MNVAYTPELRAYMQRKGKRHVVVDTCSAKTCGGPITELNVYLVDETRAAELRPRAHSVCETELGSVIVMARGLEVADSVIFGLRSFLGAKDVTAQGIRTYKF